MATLNSITRISIEEKWLHRACYTENYTLFFVNKGKLRLWTSLGHIEIVEGSLVVFEKGTRIRSGYSGESGIDFFELVFEDDFCDFNINSPYYIIEKSTVLNLFSTMCLLKEASVQNELLSALLSVTWQSQNITSQTDAIIVQKVLDYINKSAECDLDIDALARTLGLDKSHISRVFSKSTGTTLKAYANKKRIEYAKSLLAESSFDINKIASLVKFEESNLFTKFFTYHTGMTPSDYRRSISGTMPFNG